MYAAVLANGQTITHTIAPGRHAWVQGAAGDIEVNGMMLKEGDGVAVSDEASLTLRGAGTAGGELLLFDLA
jgi:redox-sensitive bicupin YhaK (pirin superfamily)